MNLERAYAEAYIRLAQFIGLVDFPTEVLNEIENITNLMIWEWQQQDFFVLDLDRRVVNGIKLWYDPFDGYLRAELRLAKETV